MNRSIFDFFMQPNVVFLMDTNLQLLYQIQTDHLLSSFPHQSKRKVKGYFEFLNLILLYFLNRVFEQSN